MPLFKSQIFLFLLFVSSALNSVFRYSLIDFQKCLLVSRITLFRLPSTLWFESCNDCILACTFWSKNHEQSSSKHGLCCFNSYRYRLSLVVFLALNINININIKPCTDMWIYFVQDKGKRLDFVNTEMKLRFPRSV